MAAEDASNPVRNIPMVEAQRRALVVINRRAARGKQSIDEGLRIFNRAASPTMSILSGDRRK